MNKLFRNRQNSGITLIALVIHIVVIVILAGVAINLSLSENGIFNKAKYAVEQQKMAEVKERVELAIADIQTDKITKGEECTVDTIISELPGKISGITISKEGENAKGTYNGCDFTITPDLKVTIDGYNPAEGGSGSSENGSSGGNDGTEISSDNYGNYIDYPIDLNGDRDTTNDWMIFYQNGSDTFIIAEYYLKNTDERLDLNAMNAAAYKYSDSEATRFKYSIGWNASNDIQETNHNTLFMFNKYNLNSSYYSSVSVSSLLNTNNWTGYVNTSYADYAIGAPTVEMWVASWNKKFGSEITLYTDTGYAGYYVGTEKNPTTYTVTCNSVEGREGYSLYFPTTENVKDYGDYNCVGYFLASPSAFMYPQTSNPNQLLGTNCYGSIQSREQGNYGCSLRPVVHLKSGTTLTKNPTTGIWEF